MLKNLTSSISISLTGVKLIIANDIKEKIEVNQLQLGLGHTLLISDVFNYNTAFYKDNAFAGDLFFYLKRKNIKNISALVFNS